MMTPETPAIFDGQPVRIVASDLGPVIPVPDIARVIGCDRSNMTRIIKSNNHLFEGLTSTQTLPSSGGHQRTVCLTRDGVLGILMKVHPGRAHDDETALKIAAFQRWAVKTLGEIIDRGRVQNEGPRSIPAVIDGARIEPPDLLPVIEEEFELADLISRRTGGPLADMQAVALSRAGRKLGEDFGDYAKLIPRDSDEAGYMTPAQIGTVVGWTSDKVNAWLVAAGLQVRASGTNYYTATAKGREFGKVFPWYNPATGRHGYQLRWRDDILISIPGGRQQRLAVAEGT